MMKPRSVTVDKMAGIFTKRIWQTYTIVFSPVVL